MVKGDRVTTVQYLTLTPSQVQTYFNWSILILLLQSK